MTEKLYGPNHNQIKLYIDNIPTLTRLDIEDVASVASAPKVIVPRACTETTAPLRPSMQYFIGSPSMYLLVD